MLNLTSIQISKGSIKLEFEIESSSADKPMQEVANQIEAEVCEETKQIHLNNL